MNEFIAECKDCCWRFSTSWEPRADTKADEHTKETGHETVVKYESDPKPRTTS